MRFVKTAPQLTMSNLFFSTQYNSEEVEVTHRTLDLSVDLDGAGTRVSAAPSSTRSGSKPPVTPDRGQKKKKGLFSGLFSRKPRDGAVTPSSTRAGSRLRKVKG
jgi:hypothetical protein